MGLEKNRKSVQTFLRRAPIQMGAYAPVTQINMHETKQVKNTWKHPLPPRPSTPEPPSSAHHPYHHRKQHLLLIRFSQGFKVGGRSEVVKNNLQIRMETGAEGWRDSHRERAPTALAEGLSSLPSTRLRWLTSSYNSSPKGSDGLFWFAWFLGGWFAVKDWS